MTSRDRLDAPPFSPLPLPFGQAAQAFLETRGAGSEREAALLAAFEEHLGPPAPLLAYTRPTAEAWRRTLPDAEQAEAGALLTAFRAFLRDGGWLDAARPVNWLD